MEKIIKALVTGGTGFTGSNLVKKLSSLNYQVRVLARPGSKTDLLGQMGVEIVTGDIKDKESVFEAVKGTDIIFHIAAAYRQANLPDSEYWEVNFNGTKNILDAALKYNVKRLIHCSTIGIVSSVKNPPADETVTACPDDVYQQSKCAAEFEVLSYAKEKNLPASVIRPCAIYGPQDMRLLKMFKMIAAKKFLFFGNGKALFHMVYIDDLLDAFLLCSQKEEAVGEVFIIGGERYTTLNELSKLIAAEFVVPPPKIHIPYLPFEVAAAVVEFIYTKLKIKKEPPIYRRRMAFYKKNRAFSIEKARRILGYNPRFDLKTGIHLTAKWYMENGYIKK
ncbi:MAG: NAD-dependent epimerase/dehydratase family protein [Actinobacteria bacterium]|nr:NAD-dependent epimerase/dehydratase family protein [Actinomycetota bacterium]